MNFWKRYKQWISRIFWPVRYVLIKMNSHHRSIFVWVLIEHEEWCRLRFMSNTKGIFLKTQACYGIRFSFFFPRKKNHLPTNFLPGSSFHELSFFFFFKLSFLDWTEPQVPVGCYWNDIVLDINICTIVGSGVKPQTLSVTSMNVYMHVCEDTVHRTLFLKAICT